MKYIKTFESYTSPEEEQINKMLDNINKQKLSNKPYKKSEPEKRSKEQDYIDFFQKYKPITLSIDDLVDIIEVIEDNNIQIFSLRSLLNDHPELHTDPELKDLWTGFIKSKYDK